MNFFKAGFFHILGWLAILAAGSELPDMPWLFDLLIRVGAVAGLALFWGLSRRYLERDPKYKERDYEIPH